MRHPIVEQYLNQHQVPFEYREQVPIASIDLARSHANWARAGNPDLKDVQETYADEMRKGTDFPALVAYEQPSGLVLIDGNQRTAAAIQAGRPALDAYVVDIKDDYALTSLTYGINTLNGVPPTREQKLQQAMELRRKYAKSWREISNVVGLSAHVLASYSLAYEQRNRWMMMGGDPGSLSVSGWAALAPLKFAAPFAAAARLAVEAKLAEPDIDALVHAVLEQPSETKQMETIQNWRQRADIRLRMLRAAPAHGPIAYHADPILGIRRHLNTVRSIFRRRPSASQLGITNVETLREARSWWDPIREQMDTVLAEAEAQLSSSGISAEFAGDTATLPGGISPLNMTTSLAEADEAAATTGGSRRSRRRSL